MRIFDTHCHLADPQFDADRGEVIARMREAGVCRANVVADPCEEPTEQGQAGDVVGCTAGRPTQVPAHAQAEEAADGTEATLRTEAAPSAVARVIALVRAQEGFVFSVGVHPQNAERYDAAAEEELLRCLEEPRCCLLGEIGLDYHYELPPREVQREVFGRQLELAYRRGVPVQLHIRDAHGDCMELLRARAAAGRLPSGILHCYTGSWEAAKVYLKLGFYISFSGALSFKNAAKLTEVARNAPAGRLLIETDCPYMAPVPLRGRRNEPAYLPHTLSALAAARGVAAEELAEQVYANSLRAFGLA